jgi:RimJ/RimL family protein N-acetyltransferase
MKIELKDLSEAEIPFILSYWYHSPEGFIEAMGVDLNKLPSEKEMKKLLMKRVEDNSSLTESKLNALIILVEGRPVGVHSLTPFIQGDHGIFHAHICDASMRGKGIALESYPMACKVFAKRFSLKKIVFKTPEQNIGAIKVKERLGIPMVGEEIIDFDIIKPGTKAKVFEWQISDF